MKLLILGGYGVFGGRLAQLLADMPNLDILIAGRNLAAAKAFCDRWTGAARLRPVRAERDAIAALLAAEAPDLIVDASGPFQDYGPNPYGVVEAAIAHGVSYLDFADGSDFVQGIARFDAAARDKGLFVLSGVSSFPVLTAAVLAEMAQTMTIADVRGGIAPSPYAGVGMNVMRAVLGYAGQPVRLRRKGADSTGIGLGESLRYTVAVPGALPLRNIRFSLVDVPDLRLIPALMPSVQSLWMGAGPVPEVLHRMLNLLARARSALHLPNLAPLAPLCYRVLNACTFGEHRGGMFLEAAGAANGKPVTRSWHLLAEADDGPLIPSMAIEAIIRKLHAGAAPAPGARSAVGALTLADYDALFAKRRIRTGWREDSAAGPLYPRLLGAAFEALPPLVQALHRPGPRSQWAGRAQVTRGKGLLPRVVAALFGFPRAGADVPVTVTFATDAKGVETWERNFGGRVMRSTQRLGQARNTHLMDERFGPLRFGLALVQDGDRLRLIPRRWSFLGLPLPSALMPRGNSHERQEEDRFCFHVEIDLPLIGNVVCYDGWLRRAE
ncbi:DUF4166 domain-containing protein [Pseudorhodobacter sp. E13]|uniref:SDR family oxidoreductase n=1 Tax=Pseudorhodobacter sp. E13 TaxID=2487931 RepID=UPI000F8F8095|nr:SDR family oxidoreductase [Pseudorhodobacter sp. E13]RUS63578.1 DUF4166 domain-containing protein [Pseudorhodobacter sp. E13]